MKLNQNDLEWIVEMVRTGQMTANQANVEKVRMARVQVVTARIPADVRATLNAAVRERILCHKKKDGRKPEVYYHPNFEHLANAERNRVERETIGSLAGVLAFRTREDQP